MHKCQHHLLLVRVQTKSKQQIVLVGACYRPDCCTEQPVGEPVDFYWPVPGVLIHTVTGVQQTCIDMLRSVQERACKEHMTVVGTKTELYKHVHVFNTG